MAYDLYFALIDANLQIDMQMQAEKLQVQPAHNQVLTTLLPSNQVKHLAFLRVDAPKTLFFRQQELKLVTGLATATHDTLTLYAVYEQAQALMLGSWRLHQDITGIVGWDRLVIVSTAQRLVGFRYEGGFLRSSFMVSLQFLPVQQQDHCKVYGDRMGYYLVITIRNYLIFCFSQTLANKYKSRVVQKQKVEVVGEEVRWNDPQAPKPFILDMVKVKLTDLGISGVEQVKLVDDTVYFLGHRGKENVLYYIHVYYFFNSQLRTAQEVTLASPLPLRDQPPANTNILINHPRGSSSQHSPDYLFCSSTPPISLTLKSQQNLYDIANYANPIEVFSLSSTMFPILVWQPSTEKFSLIQRFKTFQDNYEFKHSDVASGIFAQTVIYRQGLIVTASRTEVVLITSQGQKQVLHESIGSIIDLHVGKELLFIENNKNKETRLWQMSRGPRVDPRPFMTHKKKMFLQQMNELKTLYSVPIGQTEVLAAKIGNVFKFFKEGSQFQVVLEAASEYFTVKGGEGENFILLRKTDGKSGLICGNEEGIFKVETLEWEGWAMDERWCQDDYLIARTGKFWSFFDIFKKTLTNFTLPLQRENNIFIDSFFSFRTVSPDKHTKDNSLLELYLSFNNLLQVWLLNLTRGEKRFLYRAINPGEGSPILTNQLIGQQYEPYLKDRWRSITCPQYSLAQQSIRSIYNKNVVVIASHLYQSQKKTLLLLVTSEQQLLIYRKYFNLDQSGFLLRRVCTPLNVVKNFVFNEDKPFKDLGQGVTRAGNFLLYKGQLLESITMTTSARSLFKMEGRLWGLLLDGRIRQVQLGSAVTEGFWLRQIDCNFKEQLMSIDSTSQYYCVYCRKGFQIFSKQLQSHWKCQLGNQTIVTVKLFDHFVGMSYYDYYRDEQGVSDYESVRFRFRIYNCATKNKVLQRQKALDEPILHIRYMHPQKLLLVTSSVIFINLFKNDKTQLEPFRAHNFTAKRSFITAFAHIPDILPNQPGAYGSPTYMLFGGSHGGLGFYVGKWIEEEKLKEQWFQGLRCPIKQVCFFHFGEEQESQLKALIVDQESNLMVLSLKKDHAQKIADIRLPARVNSIRSKSGQGFVVFSGLEDGSIRLLTTVKLDNSQDGFLDFQNVFCKQLPFVGGFNLRWSRQLQQQYRSSRFVSKGNIIDGDLLQQFFSMTNALQHYISQQCETDISTLLGALPF